MGGSTANLLAVRRVHHLDAILREAWNAGVVLCGISAGANCWFTASTTDSFGPVLQALPDGAAARFDGVQLAEIVSSRPAAGGYRVERDDGGVTEIPLPVRYLG